MDNPGQFLIHFTNRGPKVFSTHEGSIGEFKVSANQPLKDINKFGLLHYSIPKMCDHVDDNTRYFTMMLMYRDGTEVRIPVRMPELDYYNMFISQEFDHSVVGSGNHGRNKEVLAFDEVLQTTLNWAIMEEYDRITAPGPQGPGGLGYSLAQLMLCRVSCIVKRDKRGHLEIYVGYRGSNIVNNNQDEEQQHYAPDVLANTGSPFEWYNCITPGGHTIDGAGQNTPLTVAANVPYQVPNNDPLDRGTLGPPTGAQVSAISITQIHLEGLSMRMQLMLGAEGRDVYSEELLRPNNVTTRGRVRLKNYVDPTNNIRSSGGVVIQFNIPPNLDPPSFMYLQLTVPGTRSKILGQNDERGGWAIPTAANHYISNVVNMPAGPFYHRDAVRYVPAVVDFASFATLFANKNPSSGVGYNFDYLPLNARIAVNGIRHLDNYNMANPNVPFSRLLRIGQVKADGTPIRPKQRFARSGSGSLAGELGSGFGLGPFRKSGVFTVSLIEPNFVFTSVENATMQTFDVRLMWGDTSEVVAGIAGNPVQFSLIASP